LIVDALGYLLEEAHLQGWIRGISLPRWEEMINNHFVDDSLLLVSADEESISTERNCLAVVCEASGEIVSDHNI
jgi:hypothetical protein